MTSKSFKYAPPMLQGLTETASCRSTLCQAGASANYLCKNGAVNVGCGNCADNCANGTYPNSTCHTGGTAGALTCWTGDTDTTQGCCKTGTSAGKGNGCITGTVNWATCINGNTVAKGCSTGSTHWNNCSTGPCG